MVLSSAWTSRAVVDVPFDRCEMAGEQKWVIVMQSAEVGPRIVEPVFQSGIRGLRRDHVESVESSTGAAFSVCVLGTFRFRHGMEALAAEAGGSQRLLALLGLRDQRGHARGGGGGVVARVV